jgi:hypothetical protein
MSTISNNNIILRSKNIVIENSRYDLSEYNSSIISGFQGPQGFQGILGFQGLGGSASNTGATGLQGYQGNQGGLGFQGYQGIIGFQGNQGYQGGLGFQGYQGIIGPQGFQGYQGNQGGLGFQGYQGIIGPQGFQGNQGYQGGLGFQGNQGRQGIIGPQGFQGIFGPTGGGGALGFYGSFYDTTIQTALTSTTGYAFKLNTTAESYGVLIENNGSGNPTHIKVFNQGVYNIQFSAQLDKSSGSTAHIEIWLRKNGTDIPDSATIVAIQGTNAETVPAWNFMLSLNANDYIELMWRTDDTNLLILYEPATSIRPVIPSLIVTVQQVMNTQIGPTGPTGASNSTFQTGITISATTSNPVISTRSIDQINYRTIGDKYKICYKLGWSAGTAGSGDYLIDLPTGITFNTTSGYNPTYTGAYWSPNVNSIAPYLIPVVGGIVQSGNWNNSIYVIPYDSNSFRLAITNNNLNSFLSWNNTFFPLSTEGTLQLEFEIWK